MATGATKYAIMWLRVYFGAHLLYSAGRHYLTPWSAEIPGPGGRFVASLIETGLYEIVKGVEGVVGLLLVFNVFVPLAVLVELPISVVIFWLNYMVVGTGYQIFTGIQEIVLNAVLAMCYFGYFRSALVRRSVPQPLWTFWPFSKGKPSGEVPGDMP